MVTSFSNGDPTSWFRTFITGWTVERKLNIKFKFIKKIVFLFIQIKHQTNFKNEGWTQNNKAKQIQAGRKFGKFSIVSCNKRQPIHFYHFLFHLRIGCLYSLNKVERVYLANAKLDCNHLLRMDSEIWLKSFGTKVNQLAFNFTVKFLQKHKTQVFKFAIGVGCKKWRIWYTYNNKMCACKCAEITQYVWSN